MKKNKKTSFLYPQYLPTMQTRVSDFIQVFQSALWQLNSTYIHYQGTTMVFDPAYLPNEIQLISNLCPQAQKGKRYIVYTHGDFDHVVGCQSFEGFEQVGSKAMADRPDIQRVLIQMEAFDHENYISRPYPVGYPELDHKLIISESHTIRLGTIEILVYKAGGHTADGLFYIIPDLKLWIAGDYLSDIEFPFIEDGIDQYFRTMARATKIVNEFEIDFMIPGHGSIAFTKEEIVSRIERSINYLDSLRNKVIPDWRVSWGHSPFETYLDKMHQNNLAKLLK